MKLDLRASLFYDKIDVLPSPIPETGEFLLCYKLNPTQSRSIEPDRAQFLGSLLFTGKKTTEESKNTGTEAIFLPQGHYLFTQQRSVNALNGDDWLDLAIEQQKDGLWERNKPGELLYVRFFYEDSAFVTQIFRVID